MSFELLIALRYLKARRTQAVISVVGVTFGVMALVVALAVNEGFREDLQKKLLGAQAHVQLLDKAGGGVSGYGDIADRVGKIEGVISAAPAVYMKGMIYSNGNPGDGVQIKGVIAEREGAVSTLKESIVEGSLENLHGNAILIGRQLAKRMHWGLNDRVFIQSTATRSIGFYQTQNKQWFDVVGIFEFGLYDLDSSWVYVPLDAAQRLAGVGDVASTVEVKLGDLDSAPKKGREIVDAVGANLTFQDWTELNRPIFHALQLERLVMFLTTGLIVLVAALNIVAMQVMLVLEKTRDIAILMSMGAVEKSIRRTFMYQGVIIGIVGAVAGLILGNAISYVADTYKLVSLAADVYSIAYVPFQPRVVDSAIIAGASILVSFLATLHPSRTASKLLPVEALRYE